MFLDHEEKHLTPLTHIIQRHNWTTKFLQKEQIPLFKKKNKTVYNYTEHSIRKSLNIEKIYTHIGIEASTKIII